MVLSYSIVDPSLSDKDTKHTLESEDLCAGATERWCSVSSSHHPIEGSTALPVILRVRLMVVRGQQRLNNIYIRGESRRWRWWGFLLGEQFSSFNVRHYHSYCNLLRVPVQNSG